jgi:hypothetical protein
VFLHGRSLGVVVEVGRLVVSGCGFLVVGPGNGRLPRHGRPP